MSTKIGRSIGLVSTKANVATATTVRELMPIVTAQRKGVDLRTFSTPSFCALFGGANPNPHDDGNNNPWMMEDFVMPREVLGWMSLLSLGSIPQKCRFTHMMLAGNPRNGLSISPASATSSAETWPQHKSCLTDRYSFASSCAVSPRLPCAVRHLDDGGENDDRSNGNPGRDRRRNPTETQLPSLQAQQRKAKRLTLM